MPKDSFIIHHDQRKLFERLGVTKLGELIFAMMDYSEFGTERQFEDVELGVAFSAVQPFMDKNTKRYEAVCERNRKNGALGGRPKGNPNEPKKPSGFYNNPKNPVGADTDIDLDSCLSLKSLPQSQETAFTQVGGGDAVSPTGSLSESKAGAKFVPPSLEEITAYLNEKGSTIDPEAFWAFYESKGWMVGKNKMKSWKAAVRTWEIQRKPQAKPEDTSWHKYRTWAEKYISRRRSMHPETPEPTPEEIDAGALAVASLIGPDNYSEELIASSVNWILASNKRCAHVLSLANLIDPVPKWGMIITWASNGARGVDVGDGARGDAG